MKLMYVLGAIVSLLFFTSCKRTSKIDFKGLVNGVDGTRVRITSDDFLTIYDSTRVKNNRFSLKVSLPKDGFYQIDFLTKTKDGFEGTAYQFYAENNGVYVLKSTGFDNLITNHYSKINSSSDTENKLSQLEKIWLQKRDSLINVKKKFENVFENKLTDEHLYHLYGDSIISLENEISDAKESAILQFVQSDSTSIVTPYYITKTTKLFENYSIFKAALNKISPKIKRSEYYQQAVDLLKSVEHISKGAKARELYGKDTSGTPLNNEYKKSKLILISFWASYCIPCREEVPELKKIYNQYKGKGFEIVSVSIDVSKDNWLGASEKDKLPWFNICECVPEEQSENIKNYVVKSVPTSYLINGDGKILYKDIWIDKLKSVLKSELR